MEEENREILFDSINVDYNSLYDDYCTDCTNFKEEPKDRYSEDFIEWVDNQQQDIYRNLMDNIKGSIYDDKSIIINMIISSQNKVFFLSSIYWGLYNALLYCIENADKFTIAYCNDELHITVECDNNVINHYEISIPRVGIKLNELNL